MKTIVKKEIINNLEISTISVSNEKDFSVDLLSLGATLDKIYIDNKIMNVTPKTLNGHFNNDAKFGKVIGRYAGRIEDGKFCLNGKQYQLDLNNGTNCLHGGLNGIGEKNFYYDVMTNEDETVVTFKLFDVENLFPGDVNFEIKYIINADMEIEIEYHAISNKDTIINLTNHTYFNLSGNLQETVVNQKMMINASKFTDLKDNMCLNEIKEVSDVMDFRKEKLIGKDIEDKYLQEHVAKGYDHCFLLNQHTYNDVVCSLESNEGYHLDVYTTYPAVVVYSTNYPDTVDIVSGTKPRKYEGICFECQYMPNSINYSNETVLKANSEYFEKTKFKFRRVK